MSYNKFLNKILNKENVNNYIFEVNSKSGLIKENSNIQINQFDNEDIKIENNDLVLSKISLMTDVINPSSELNTLSNVFIKNDKFLNILSKFKIYNQQNNLNLEVTDTVLNPTININSNVVNVSSKTNSKNIYGNIQYVDKDKTIQYIQSGSSGTFSISRNAQSGFDLYKRNANLRIDTYITCDPDDGFSNYDKRDIVANTGVAGNYNYVNRDGIYTNTLYLKPGNVSETKKNYLAGNEHVFVIDYLKSVLPGWGFEQNHPLNRIPQYSSTILPDTDNNTNEKKRYQSIAIDFSGLIGNISPGYKFTFLFQQKLQNSTIDPYPDCVSSIIHNDSYNILDLNNNTWIDNTFDSRFANIQKSDLDSDSSFKDLFKVEEQSPLEKEGNNLINNTFDNSTTSFSYLASLTDGRLKSPTGDTLYNSLKLNLTFTGTSKSKFYNLPYYDTNPSFIDSNANNFFDITKPDLATFTFSWPTYLVLRGVPGGRYFLGVLNTDTIGSTNATNAKGTYPTNRFSRYNRPIGNYSENRFVINYFKPKLLINLGENNIILNDYQNNNNPLVKGDYNLITNANPYYIDNQKLKNVYTNNSNSEITKKYFFTNFSCVSNEFNNNHLDLLDQNKAENESIFYVNNSSKVLTTIPLSNPQSFNTDFNLYNNLTIKLNKNFISNIILNNDFFILYSTYTKNTKHRLSLAINNAGAYEFAYHTVKTKLLRSKYIINIPFINMLKANQINERLNDWYYLNSFKTTENLISKTSIPQYEFFTKDISVENRDDGNTLTQFPAEHIVRNDIYGISSSINNDKSFIYDNTTEQFTLMYVGFNSTLNRHEWCYV